MKNVHFILLYFILLFIISCKKKEVINTSIIRGYIYNSNDSTPYKNTKFKLYSSSHTISGVLKVQEELFFTDSNGYFDYSTTTMTQGKIVWPSYEYGSAYLGPQKLGNVKSETRDDVNRIYIYYYDTLYSEPWN